MSSNNHASQEHLVIFMPSGRRGRVASGRTLLEAARDVGVSIESICGGRLTCNKCRVLIEENLIPDDVTIALRRHDAHGGNLHDPRRLGHNVHPFVLEESMRCIAVATR